MSGIAIDPTRTINGSYGQIFHEGKWMSNLNKMEANIEINKEEVKISGRRWSGHKVMGVSGSGSIAGYMVTSELKEAAMSVAADRGVEFRTELIAVLDDPESFGAERVRLKGVSFDSIPLINFEVGSIVEEEWSFTFEGCEILDPIEEK